MGTSQYVQWVNESFAVFDKSTGKLLLGPVAGNTLWSGFADNCATHNDGDPIVQFDQKAQRWVMTQFVVSTTPYEQCVAVSTSADATGTWNRYSFSYGTTQFNDYPKLGVWPDPNNNAYFISYNIFANGTSFSGAKVCAFDRAAMLAGAAATQQCFQLSSAYGGLLPADLDGQTLPPSGSPGMFLNFTSNTLNLWRFNVDWSNTANTALTGPFSIPGVLPFTAACNGGTCIPQPGVSQQLDSLADRLMYRLAYRNFGDHEALVVDQSVAAGSSVGVRWYEIRNSGGTMATTTPYVFQQGTYAPDATYRWMGSIAMDRNGDIAVGYSGSSSSVYPYVAYATRAPKDPTGTLSGETIAKAGGGSQYCPNRLYCRSLSRWGDYSAMSVDPVDDCTFWYTNEYEKTSGAFNWSTWITPFKFSTCSSTQPLSVTTTSLPNGTVGKPYSQTLVAAGGAQPYTWSYTGSLPAGLTLSPSGTISGTPTAAATSGFTVKVTDSSSPQQTASQALSITVDPSVQPLSVTTTSLPDGTAGQAYIGATLAATGGTGSYTWAVGNGLPASLTLDPMAGTISGTIDSADTPGTYSFKVTVTDSSQQSASQDLSIAVASSTPPLSITTTSLPNGTAGKPYSQTLVAAGGSGLGTYTWSYTGSLPAGLTLDASGTISGTIAKADKPGTYSFTVTVVDSSSPPLTASQALTIRVSKK